MSQLGMVLGSQAEAPGHSEMGPRRSRSKHETGAPAGSRECVGRAKFRQQCLALCLYRKCKYRTSESEGKGRQVNLCYTR